MKLIFSHLFSPGIISHIRRLSILFLLAMIFATGIGTTRAVHASERFAVMVDEIYDGVKQESETIESFISEHLVQKGFQVADREQTLQLRKNVATADLLKGRLPDTVFSFEADYLVAGKADCEVFSTDTMGVPFKSAKCNLTLKLIQVDSGQYIGSFSEDDIAMDISKRTACRKSALQLAKQFVAKTLPKLQKRGQKSKLISLWLYDLAQRSDMDGLLAGIKAITTVSDAELRHFGKDVCKVDVKLKSGDGFKFSNALEQAAGLSLAVEQASKALVKVRYDLTKTAGLKLSVTPFKNLTRNSRYDWLKSSGAKVFASTLSNSKYIAVDANIKRRKQIPRNKRGLENTIQLVASGKFSGRSENGTLVVEIRDLSTNALFYTATSNGQLENLFSMASDTARQVDKDLLEQIKKKGLSRKYRISAGNLQKLDGYLSVIKETRFLKIKDVEVENIFPAFQARYVGKSLGKVVLANLGSRAAKDVKLQVEIPGFTKLPHETRMEQVAKGKRVEIPLNLSLDRNKVFSLDENTPAQMKVSLTYVVGDRELKDTFIKPVLIYDRNALSWQNDGAVAAFITPRDPAVKDFARQAISMAPERNKDKE